MNLPIMPNGHADLISQLNFIRHIKVSYDSDKKLNGRFYLNIEKDPNGVLSQQEFAQIKSLLKYDITNTQIADTGRYISFPIKLQFASNNPINPQPITAPSIAVLKGFTLTEVRKEFFNDPSPVFYNFAIITAEFHTYIKITNFLGESDAIGLNGDHARAYFGHMHSRAYLKGDMPYDKNYNNPESRKNADSLLNAGKFGVLHDKAVSVIEFAITPAIYQHLIEYINNEIKQLSKAYYSLSGTIAENCSWWVQRVFEEIGFKGDFFDPVKTDETDLNDKGILFNTCKNIWYNFDIKYFYSCLSSLNNYTFPGNVWQSSLLKSLNEGNADEALSLVKSHTAKELKAIYAESGEGILHFIAALEPSAVKQELLRVAIDRGLDLNKADYYNSKTPLSVCVTKNDLDCMDSIILHDRKTLKYMNHNNHKLVSLATSYGKTAYDALVRLLKENPEDAHYTANGEFNEPICILAKYRPGLARKYNIIEFEDCKTDDQLNGNQLLNKATSFGKNAILTPQLIDGLVKFKCFDQNTKLYVTILSKTGIMPTETVAKSSLPQAWHNLECFDHDMNLHAFSENPQSTSYREVLHPAHADTQIHSAYAHFIAVQDQTQAYPSYAAQHSAIYSEPPVQYNETPAQENTQTYYYGVLHTEMP